jgi:hypothetical protein
MRRRRMSDSLQDRDVYDMTAAAGPQSRPAAYLLLRALSQMRVALFWAAAAGMSAAIVLSIAANRPALSQPADDETQIAKSLAAMLRSGRTVVSRKQDRINDPTLGNKGLDGKTVLAEAIKIYQETTGTDPLSIDGKSRHGILIRMQMDAIVEVIDAHQQTINRQGVGFKGFIPAVFGRLVNESFGRRAVGNAEMKVTAPPTLIRNAKTRPDEWESEIIRDKLLSLTWPKDQLYSAVTQSKGRPAHRTAVPEYYGASCLACHGSPKGEIDITGYPKEGATAGDLGGVISITLYR